MSVWRKYWETWKNIMFNPQTAFSKLNNFRDTNIFYLQSMGITYILTVILLLLLFGGILIIFSILGSSGIEGIPDDQFPLMLLGGLAGGIILFPFALLLYWGSLYVWAGIVHLFVLMFGGKGYRETVTAIGYSSAGQPLTVIPILNYVAMFYMIFLQIMGIKARHKLTTGKAVAIVLIPTFFFMMIFGIVYIILLSLSDVF